MNTMSVVGESRVDHAVRCVRAFIRHNNLKPGDALPSEGQFATDLAVSRPVMREAFGALAALNQIDVGNGRRARVAAVNGAVLGASLDHAIATAQVSVTEVWDVRRTLELRTAELAAANRGDADAQLIRDLASAMVDDQDDLPAMIQHDIAFHQAIARASGNPLFLQIVRSFEALMREAVPAAWQTRTAVEQRDIILAQHLAIADAIFDRDARAAVTTMDAHFDASIGDLMKQEARDDAVAHAEPTPRRGESMSF